MSQLLAPEDRSDDYVFKITGEAGPPPDFQMILLDTNVISENFNVRPNRLVLAWVDSQPERDLYLCAPVVAELRYGAERLVPGRRQSKLYAAIHQTETYFAGRILPFDIAAVAAYSRLM